MKKSPALILTAYLFVFIGATYHYYSDTCQRMYRKAKNITRHILQGHMSKQQAIHLVSQYAQAQWYSFNSTIKYITQPNQIHKIDKVHLPQQEHSNGTEKISRILYAHKYFPVTYDTPKYIIISINGRSKHILKCTHAEIKLPEHIVIDNTERPDGIRYLFIGLR